MGDFNIIYLLMSLVVSLVVGYAIGIYRKSRLENSREALENSGEALVRHSLEEYCKNNNAHVLNCVTLRLEDGSTTQIDHILVSTKGIFVIETKHYKGWIFGNAKSKAWAQVIYKNKYTFQNPLLQNYKHVKVVQYIFEFLESRFIHNIVVFSGESIFKTPGVDNVYHVEELIPAIEKHLDGALSLNRIQFCVGRLEYMRLKLTRETDVEHQAYLERKFGR
ncbi:MAG: NERD domain-containing protein [Verrucomicrobia bacterium]|nr:NERD domain-containing protein [Verrucomicrobiota bacterium]